MDRLAEERLDTLLHYAEDAVLIVGPDGVIRRVNDLGTEVFGYEPASLVGQRLEDLLPERTRPIHARHVEAFADSGRQELRMANRRPVTARREDGTEVPVTVAVSTFEHGDELLYVAVVRDASAQQDLEQEISWLSTPDERRRRPSVPMVVLAMDLARLGTVNDALGHASGDALLATVAERLAALAARAGGFAGRLGGDRFVLVVPGIAYDPAVEAVAVEVAVQVAAPVRVEGTSVRLQMWQGARIWEPDGPDAGQALSDALAAVARARSERSRTVCVFDGVTRAELRARVRLAGDLRDAVEQDRLRLAYQPLVEVRSGRPVAAEALLRWDHPELGPISPETFISIAEEDDDLIDALWGCTVRMACSQLARWRHHPVLPPGFRVSVNVSARQLRSAEVVRQLRDALAESGVQPAQLCVEVTETAAMEDMDLGADVLDAIRALGVSVALDDFGTGYSSLGRLGRLPVDQIKLDGSLIRDLVLDARSVAVVSAVLSLSKVFGVSVVAECVEEREQLEVLDELGCEVVQGWYFAPAEPPERFIETIGAMAAPGRPGTPARAVAAASR